jgi:hypothetical protein
MSALDYKQTCAAHQAMSALGQKQTGATRKPMSAKGQAGIPARTIARVIKARVA